MIKVSFVVPIYKVPVQLLRKCIESLINQSLKDIEILLIDDGSPDNCGKICDEYMQGDDRIRVIHQKNKGLSGARNTGVNVAKGEYVSFVDGDDWIEPEFAEDLYGLSEKYKYDIICGGIIRDYGEGKETKIQYNKFIDNKEYFDEECLFWQKEVLDFNGNISAVYAKLIKRDLMINNNIFHDENLKQGAEGIMFNMVLFNYVKSIRFKKVYGYHYMYNSNSISSSHNEENHMYVLRCFQKIREYIEEIGKTDELLGIFYNRMIYVIITTAITGYFSPDNKEKYRIKVEKFDKYMQNKLIQQTLKKANLTDIDYKRKIVLILIKLRFYKIIELLAYLRKKEKMS